MIILPAIDIKDGKCVRLRKGEFDTAEQVAASPYDTADSFKQAGADWIHMVDLDGAKDAKPVNAEIFCRVAAESGLKVELGGGIRSMDTIEYYLQQYGLNPPIDRFHLPPPQNLFPLHRHVQLQWMHSKPEDLSDWKLQESPVSAH